MQVRIALMDSEGREILAATRDVEETVRDAAERATDLLVDRYVNYMPPDAGTVSHGTLRTDHLIVAFVDELASREPRRVTKLLEDPEVRQVVIEARAMFTAPVSDEFSDPELAQEVLYELCEALDETAPEGYYFGSHPGDGADFGFWPAIWAE